MAKQKVDEYGLTARERRFADEYIANGRNATQAYKAISPRAKETTCAVKGYEWVRKGKISDYIKQKTKERLSASSLTADDVLDELIAIGFNRTSKGLNKQVDLETGEVLRNIEYETTAKAEDRLKALELLGKNMSLFTDKVDIEGGMGVMIVDDIAD